MRVFENYQASYVLYSLNMTLRIEIEKLYLFPFQIHWNNPLRKSDYWDSSGMTMYYTANKRKFDMNMMYLGPVYLNIPPGQPSTTMTSRCSSECTRALFSDSIFVTDSSNHMHYLGKYMYVKSKKIASLSFNPFAAISFFTSHSISVICAITLGKLSTVLSQHSSFIGYM